MATAVNGHRVRAERRQRGWSQDDLSHASGVSVRTVQRLESGGRATISSLAALAATLAVPVNALTGSGTAVRRTTPLTILADIAPSLARFRRMGFGVIDTDDAGCAGIVAGGSHHLLCSQAFMLGDYPQELVAPLVGRTIPYIWVSSVDAASPSWDRVAHDTLTRAGTREALVEADGQWAILAETR